MVSKIKDTLQQSLIKKQFAWYENQIQEQTISYDAWIREKESQERECLSLKGKDLKMAVISYNECYEHFSFSNYQNADILVFHAEDGTPDMRELSLVADYFTRHPEVVILYADEDEIGADGLRKNPWLKPDWSPDTLISYFYFGGFFAVRKEECSMIEWLGDKDWSRNVYDFVLKAVEITGSAAHIDSVLFHRSKIKPWGQQKCYDDLKKAAYERRSWPVKPNGKVSVIIPSKDNPGVLSNCIHSVLESSTYRDFEIIVVDNGSNEKNRARIELMQNMLQPEYRFTYHYEPMVFNFSRMCNIGVSMATGDYILLLNDDIEITQDDWLEKMMEKAVLPHVGAVGAKLIYPGTEIIQHAGITNIHLGPAHKLQFRSDVNEYYFMKNRLPFDVLGVTGACLLVKRSIYEQAGGFNEKLRVAFNDVEFCYHLHDLGYINVVRNDVTLTHHESLSRGADDSTEKLRRLHQELNMLYELHPSIYGKDPYYHRYLISDVLDAEYFTANQYDFDRRVEKVQPQLIEGGLDPAWHNEVLRIGVEFAGDLGKWQTGKPGSGDWMIQGWTWALHVDNCRYRFNLLLKPVEKGYLADGASQEAVPEDRAAVYKLPCKRQYRPDIDANLHGIINTKLPGVCVTFDRDSLPRGEYLIGFLWEDTCSRQKLYRFSPETLTV
ncbi:MAG: glycosyltransferase [Lachnospiraceae bacterium]|nr:glycosyltransferase [Lachnospiraceae bacterium]